MSTQILKLIRTCGLVMAGSALLSAAPVTVLSYDMLNGEGHTFSYRDKSYNGSGDPTLSLSPLSNGKGLLTDGMTGITDFTANLGNGPAYEWVGWAIDPQAGGLPIDTNDNFATITFKLANAVTLNSISLFINNFGGISGVGIFSSATVSVSNDNVNFVNPILFTPNAADIANTTARFVTIPLNEVSPFQYVRVHLTHLNATTNNWIFLSEVTFDGTVVTAATPEPSSVMLSILGLLGLALKVRRRS